MSRAEYMRMNSWRAGEQQALTAFNLMDTDKDGYVSNIMPCSQATISVCV